MPEETLSTTPKPLDININVLNYNAAKVAEKLSAPGGDPASHIKFLNKKYATNGSKSKIEKVLEKMMEEAEENELVPLLQPDGTPTSKILRLKNKKGVEIEHTYYTWSPIDDRNGKVDGIFADYAGDDELMRSPDYEAFKIWFNGVVTDFFKSEGFAVQYILNAPDTGDKFHFDYPVEVATPT